MKLRPHRRLRDIGRREGALLTVLLAALLFALFVSGGPLHWVYAGTALGLLEVAFLFLGGHPGDPHPKARVLLACLAPLLPLLALSTSNVGAAAGFALGFLTTVFGVRLCLLPAIEDEDDPLTTRDLWIPAAALVIAALSAVVSSPELSSALLAGGVVLWVGAIVAIFVMRWRAKNWNSALPARIALVAAGCMLFALAIAAGRLARVDGDLRGRVQRIAERSSVPPERTMAAIAAERDAAKHDALLAETFAPRLFLASEGAAWPADPLFDVLTSDYVERSSGKRDRSPFPPALPATCALKDLRECYVLSDGCFHYGAPCATFPSDRRYPYDTYRVPGANADMPKFGVIYTRIVHRDRASVTDDQASSDAAFAGVGTADRLLGEKVTDLLQYWLYYGYDEFDAVTAIGKLMQGHESDWELVSVGLGAGRPLFVAYNQHCGGQWLPWHLVPAAYHSTPEGERLESQGYGQIAQSQEPTHPAVMVADGSQASYPAADSVRVPNWTSCKLQRTAGDLVALAAAIKEHVEVEQEVIPVALPPARADEPPMSFAGRWGLNDHEFCLTLPFGIQTGCGGDDRPGPESPRFKDDWNCPFRVVFGGGAWAQGGDPADYTTRPWRTVFSVTTRGSTKCSR